MSVGTGLGDELVTLGAGARSSSRPVRSAKGVERLAGVVLVVAAWQLASSLRLIDSQTLAGPTTVLRSGWELVRDGTLTSVVWVSARRVLEGLLIGVPIATGLALTAGLSRIGEDVVDAPMQMLRFLPIIGLQPLIVLWFGIGNTAKVSLIVLGVVFPIYINTFSAVRAIDPRHFELARSVELSRAATVRRIVIPGALPGFLVGLRLAVAVAWLILVFAEQINATNGIGYLMIHAQEFFQTDIIVVGLSVYALLGLFSDALVRLLEEGIAMARQPVTVEPAFADEEWTTADESASALAVWCQGLTRRFGDRVVLDSIELELRANEFVALLGRSGTGKSTLLRALAGLDDGIEGHALVPRGRAVVFQDARLLPWASVVDNVALGLRGADGPERARAALREVELVGHEHDWPKTLSGGEAQRVALARALVREPSLLLLDEPFGALDALTRIRMQALLAQLCAQHRPAVLLVTHDVDEAILLADRVLVLSDGRVTLDVPVDVAPPRRRSDPRFGALRSRLLAELGVDELAESIR